jgi:hypothetical protein
MEDTMTTTQEHTPPVTEAPPAEAFAERLFDAVLGGQFLQAAYLGDRLGYYDALAGADGLTSAELAGRTGTAERYAREWLEHQAVVGVLTVADLDAVPGERRFSLPPGPAEVLTDPVSPTHVLPIARMVCGVGKQIDALVTAYRTGGGVSWAQLGEDGREGQGGANRPLFLGALPRQYLPSIPEVKVGVLTGTLLAALLAAALLRLRDRRFRRIAEAETADADADGVPDVFPRPDDHTPAETLGDRPGRRRQPGQPAN